MGLIIRQSLQSSMISYIGVVVGAFNIIWLYPKFLLPEEIGLLRVIQDFVIVFVSFTHIGTLSLTERFFPQFKDPQKQHHGFLLLTLIAMLIFFIVYCILSFFFKDNFLAIYQTNSPQIQHYFDYTIPLIFCVLFQRALDSYARVHFRIVMSNFLREVVLRVMLSILITVYFLRYINFDQVMVGLIMIYAVMPLLLAFYLFKLKILYLTVDFSRITKTFIKEIFSFYAYVIVVGFHRTIISRIDVLMIPALLSTKDVGIYATAIFMGAIIDMPCRAVNQISAPIIAQAWFDHNLAQIQDVYQKSAINQFILGGLLFLGIWCNVDNIFRLMPKGDIYQAGKYVIFFIGLTRLIEMAAGASDVIMLHSRYYRFNTVLIMVLALFLFVTNLIFIPIYQITGAALATALSILLYTLIKFAFLWIKFQLQPFTKSAMWVIFALGFTWLLVSRVPVLDIVLIDIMVRSMIITILFMGIIVLFKVSGDMNTLLYKAVCRYQPS